jgi:hypothetical protein
MCFADDGGTQFFDQRLLENIINNSELITDTIVFDQTRLGDLKEYGGVVLLNTDMLQRYIHYMDYNILLLTETINSVTYVRDYKILKKNSPEAHLANGPVEINGDFFDWEVTVEINHEWRNHFTEDINRAFKVNRQMKKFENVIYNTIRLYSED